jgi:hypothetical protein
VTSTSPELGVSCQVSGFRLRQPPKLRRRKSQHVTGRPRLQPDKDRSEGGPVDQDLRPREREREGRARTNELAPPRARHLAPVDGLARFDEDDELPTGAVECVGLQRRTRRWFSVLEQLLQAALHACLAQKLGDPLDGFGPHVATIRATNSRRSRTLGALHLVPGHEDTDVERVVERPRPRLMIVKKVESSVARTVRQLNPRAKLA